MTDIAVLIDMPCGVRGFTKLTAEPEGDYQTVVVNARLTREANIKTFEHENKHIKADDLYGHGDIDEIEKRRHEE